MRVFISYNRKDYKLALKLAGSLKEAGIEIWIDEWEITTGDIISQKIQEGLSKSDFIAVILTKNSDSSGWVEKEWQSLLEEEIKLKHVKILPILAENCQIPLFLRSKKYADFRGDFDLALKKLIRAVKHQYKKVQSSHIGGRRTDPEETPKLQKQNERDDKESPFWEVFLGTFWIVVVWNFHLMIVISFFNDMLNLKLDFSQFWTFEVILTVLWLYILYLRFKDAWEILKFHLIIFVVVFTVSLFLFFGLKLKYPLIYIKNFFPLPL